MKTWLSLDEASEHLGIGKTKLYQLANDGKVPVSKLDKQWRFNISELDNWLKSNKTIENYFTSIAYNIENNDKLREPQKEAYKVVYDYFKKGGREALVQLPVGCGKSGLAAITPLGIAKGRVLVITPNVPIRSEMKDNLDITHRKCFWKRCDVLDTKDMQNGPYVCTLDTGNISVCNESHLVVTNIQQIAIDEDKWLNKFSNDYFDLIIVDEAHHSAAISWEKVLTHFPNAKILYLTATPFRSDNKELRGKRIYRYPFKSAVVNGYIKRLTAVYITPKMITLSFKDKAKKTYTLEEVLKLKEEDWFSRGIALSDECNKSIIDNSIEKLERLRFESSVKHQIIASAISINHAKNIALLYEARNYETAVIHSKMSKSDQDDVFKRLRNNELDVIVNVGMLGEGFDHPQLSVAAIFTPYRSLKPYLQFVGRIMRVVHQNSPGDPDNYGYIVTHSGMNIDHLFEQFQLFEKDDEEFWAKVIGGEEPEPPIPRGLGVSRKKIKPDLTVYGEIVEELIEQPFIDESETRDRATRDFLKLQGYADDEIEAFIKSDKKTDFKEKTVKAAAPICVQPQKELEMLRKRLSVDVNAKAKVVLDNSRLPIVGTQIPRQLFPGLAGPGQNNLVACIVMLNQEIKKRFPKDRDEWSSTDYKSVLQILPTIASELVRKLIKAKGSKNEKR